MQDTTDQSPSCGNTHNITKALQNDTLTHTHCFTPPALLLLSRSHLTVHRTGLTAAVKASLVNLTDLKSYTSPAALRHSCRNNVQQHATICQTTPEIDKTH